MSLGSKTDHHHLRDNVLRFIYICPAYSTLREVRDLPNDDHLNVMKIRTKLKL